MAAKDRRTYVSSKTFTSHVHFVSELKNRIVHHVCAVSNVRNPNAVLRLRFNCWDDVEDGDLFSQSIAGDF